MPLVTLHRDGETYQQEVEPGSNLVVLAGIKKFPQVRYSCGMGRCTKCVSRIISGLEYLPEPNWKEQKVLGEKLQSGYRMLCQIQITHDIVLEQE